jgi:hypothetical protein
MPHDAGPTADDGFCPRMSRRGFVGALAGAAGVASVAAPVAAERTQPITEGSDGATRTLSSPDGSIEVNLDVSTGTPTYEGTTVVEPSELGMELSGGASLTTTSPSPGRPLTRWIGPGNRSGALERRSPNGTRSRPLQRHKEKAHEFSRGMNPTSPYQLFPFVS